MRISILTLLLALMPLASKADDQLIMIDALLDGLHQDAHEGNFETYFARYTSDAIFLGTDKTDAASLVGAAGGWATSGGYAAPSMAGGWATSGG